MATHFSSIHWLHLAGSLGRTITSIQGFRPDVPRDGPDTQVKSMMVAFPTTTARSGRCSYSREIPSLLRGLRLSKLLGRQGVISFESNGAVILVRGRGFPGAGVPGFRGIRGYRAMYRDFVGSIRDGRAPEMSLERAIEDQRLMDQIYATIGPAPAGRRRCTSGSDTSPTSSSSAAAPAAGPWRGRCRTVPPGSSCSNEAGGASGAG